MRALCSLGVMTEGTLLPIIRTRLHALSAIGAQPCAGRFAVVFLLRRGAMWGHEGVMHAYMHII